MLNDELRLTFTPPTNERSMPPMPSLQLARVVLRVRSPETLARFYAEHLGMTIRSDGHGTFLSYGGADAAIELRQAGSDVRYTHRRSDRYWKIGITLPNVDLAHAQLRKDGMAVSNPTQFAEIGYMCHLSDPEGFTVELLQHSFLGNRDNAEGDPAQRLGGGARIGQITLRVADLDQALAFYRDRLGMTLLSVQPVEDHGFTLYFLAFTDERPPDLNLAAIVNREWLWKRPYTTLELQHVHGQLDSFDLPERPDCGFDGIVIAGQDCIETRLHDEAGGKVYVQPVV